MLQKPWTSLLKQLHLQFNTQFCQNRVVIQILGSPPWSVSIICAATGTREEAKHTSKIKYTRMCTKCCYLHTYQVSKFFLTHRRARWCVNFFFPVFDAYCCTLEKVGNKAPLVLDLGSNVSPLPWICPAYGCAYVGYEFSGPLQAASMRDFFGKAVKMIQDKDKNFAEWAAGVFCVSIMC